MKTLYITIICFLSFSIVSCGDDDTNQFHTALVGEWTMTTLTGGFAGFDCYYEKNSIVWTFSDDGKLDIENLSIAQIPLCGGGGLNPDQTLDYDLLDVEDRRYLLLSGSENGEITEVGDTLIIDQNSLSMGSGADGFRMSFVKL